MTIECRRPDLPLARILGWLAGDGHVEKRAERRRKTIHCELRFFPDDLSVAEAFCASFRERFGVSPTIRNTTFSLGCYTVRIANASIVNYLLSLTSFGHFGWRSPNFEFEEEFVQWVKSFFDCEAYVNSSSGSVQVKSVNRQGLWQIDKGLRKLGIASRFYGPYHQKSEKWSSYYLLQIRGRAAIERYREVVDFNHPPKREKLDSLVGSKSLHRLTELGDPGTRPPTLTPLKQNRNQ